MRFLHLLAQRKNSTNSKNRKTTKINWSQLRSSFQHGTGNSIFKCEHEDAHLKGLSSICLKWVWRAKSEALMSTSTPRLFGSCIFKSYSVTIGNLVFRHINR